MKRPRSLPIVPALSLPVVASLSPPVVASLSLLQAIVPSCARPIAEQGDPRAEMQERATRAFIQASEDGTRFVRAGSDSAFVAWGFNYDHDHSGRLLEAYWIEEWPGIVEDFREMKALGANVVRIHLQLGAIMRAAEEPDANALRQLARLLALGESTGLFLNITGLGCYHKEEVPAWYDALDVAERWQVQARFWETVAATSAESPAVFCYDLMNEPILPGAGEQATEWLAGDFGGKHFVQRIALDLEGRKRKEVAEAWVKTLVSAIRKHDDRHMITVGVIPWAHVFPGAEPIFYSPEVRRHLDFASVHYYPERGEVDRALASLRAYEVGMPLLVEETSQLYCGIPELGRFIDGSASFVDGYLGFYWGRTIEDYERGEDGIPGAIMKEWLLYFRDKAPTIVGGG